ncbi:MAG: hypothetical protein ACK5UY_04670 [Holosporales bacterium]
MKMLFFFLLLCAALPAWAGDIQPPTLVPCKTAATCDRDPQHLEKFLTDFYRWYIERKDYETEILVQT